MLGDPAAARRPLRHPGQRRDARCAPTWSTRSPGRPTRPSHRESRGTTRWCAPSSRNRGARPTFPDLYQKLLSGLVGVTQSGEGTTDSAFTASPTAWPVAGKTGTAQVTGKVDTCGVRRLGAGRGGPAPRLLDRRHDPRIGLRRRRRHAPGIPRPLTPPPRAPSPRPAPWPSRRRRRARSATTRRTPPAGSAGGTSTTTPSAAATPTGGGD